MKILSIDPGGTTGICLWTGGNELSSWEIGEGQYRELWRLLGVANPVTIILERFDNRAIPGVDLSPVEVIGIVRLWTQQRDVALYMQRPSDVMPFWTDNKLKALSFYTPAKPHANDATRHMLHHLTFTAGLDRFIKRLKTSLPSPSSVPDFFS